MISEVKGKVFLFCNEAIVRGVLEYDVKVVLFSPRPPVSEILDIFYQISDKMDVKKDSSSCSKRS